METGDVAPEAREFTVDKLDSVIPADHRLLHFSGCYFQSSSMRSAAFDSSHRKGKEFSCTRRPETFLSRPESAGVKSSGKAGKHSCQRRVKLKDNVDL